MAARRSTCPYCGVGCGVAGQASGRDLTLAGDALFAFDRHAVEDLLPGLDQAEAISFFTGAVMRWFRDAFGGGRDYAALEAEARQVPPGAYGIIPVFSDVMRYGHWFHAAP